MKTILVDAIYTFVSNEGEMSRPLFELLEAYPNRKILLTGGDDAQVEKWKLKSMPYEFFTLKHNPDKSDPKYYETMFAHFGLRADEVVYFEHDIDAVKSAESAGITAYHYDEKEKDLLSLKEFLDENL